MRILLVLLMLTLVTPCHAQDLASFLAVTKKASGADYKPTVAKIYIHDKDLASNVRVVCYDSSGDKMFASSTTTAANGVVSCTITGANALTPGSTVYLFFYTGTYTKWADPGDTYKCNYVSASFPTDPSTIDPSGDSTDSGMGTPAVWLENSNGDFLVGDNNTAAKTTFSSSNRNFYFKDGYTVTTL